MPTSSADGARKGVGQELGDALRRKVALDACDPPTGNADAEARDVPGPPSCRTACPKRPRQVSPSFQRVPGVGASYVAPARSEADVHVGRRLAPKQGSSVVTSLSTKTRTRGES